MTIKESLESRAIREVITHSLCIIVSSLLSFCMSDGDLFLHNFNLDCKFEGIFNCSLVSNGCCTKFFCSQVKSRISASKTF